MRRLSAFFGIGDVSGVSWGLMIQNGRSQLETAPHMVLFPAMAWMRPADTTPAPVAQASAQQATALIAKLAATRAANGAGLAVLVETAEGTMLWDTSCPRDWETRWAPTGLQDFFPYDNVSDEEYLDSRLNQMERPRLFEMMER